MLYKTIALGLVENSPQYDQLRKAKKVTLAAQLAQALKASHEHYKAALTKTKQATNAMQIETEAAELALADLEASLAGYLDRFLDKPESHST